MRLRTIKKLSKLAAPILVQHFGRCGGEIFPAAKGDNYHGLIIRCNHERRPHGGGYEVIQGMPHEEALQLVRRCECGWHPLKGTMMIGRIEGHEEPEWNERTCWDELNSAVYWEGRQATMTDAEWERCQRIARTTPTTKEEIASMLSDASQGLSCWTFPLPQPNPFPAVPGNSRKEMKINITFPFAIGSSVRIKISGETRTIRSLIQHHSGTQSALVYYKAADGRAVEAYWELDQIEAA